ncbi:hypothetical protein STEG23_009225, partial [Scotinomys teguina]
ELLCVIQYTFCRIRPQCLLQAMEILWLLFRRTIPFTSSSVDQPKTQNVGLGDSLAEDVDINSDPDCCMTTDPDRRSVAYR